MAIKRLLLLSTLYFSLSVRLINSLFNTDQGFSKAATPAHISATTEQWLHVIQHLSLRSEPHVVNQLLRYTYTATHISSTSVLLVGRIKTVQLVQCVCLCVQSVTFELTSDLDMWQAASSWLYLGQVQRSTSDVIVQKSQDENVYFSAKKWYIHSESTIWQKNSQTVAKTEPYAVHGMWQIVPCFTITPAISIIHFLHIGHNRSPRSLMPVNLRICAHCFMVADFHCC